MTAEQDDNDKARPARRSAPQPLSMDADDEQDSEMRKRSILQQQVATALRIKQKLGHGLKRSGGAQLLSAQEDFADEGEPTDALRTPPASAPTIDPTKKVKVSEAEMMSVSQLKAELHGRGIDASQALEKEELVRRLVQVSAEYARSVDADGRVVV